MNTENKGKIDAVEGNQSRNAIEAGKILEKLSPEDRAVLESTLNKESSTGQNPVVAESDIKPKIESVLTESEIQGAQSNIPTDKSPKVATNSETVEQIFNKYEVKGQSMLDKDNKITDEAFDNLNKLLRSIQ